MTTLPKETACAVCGARSAQIVLMSVSAFGASDLDTRPPEMMRSRRSGQFANANQMAARKVPTSPEEDPEEQCLVLQVLAFERMLAERGDRACYTIDDATYRAG